MTLIQETVSGLRHDLTSYFHELASLVPHVVKFFRLALVGLFILAITPFYGSFMLSLYVWDSRDWRNQLTELQRIGFWIASFAALAANWLAAGYAILYFHGPLS